MPQPNIILTGFMGTGKSTLGRLLAKRIGYQFVDTDAAIEKRAGKTISELFRDRGEAVFRRLEAELAKELSRRQGLVIATGGGLVMNPGNVAALQQTGTIICLTASPDEILARVSKQGDIRPLLQEVEPKNKVIQLLQERQPVYGQFPQLNTGGRTPEQLVDDLIQLADTKN